MSALKPHIAFTVLFLFLSQISAALEDTVTPNDRVFHRLNVRDAPNSEASIIGYLTPEEEKPFISEAPYYYEIEYQNGQSGFVSKAYSIKLTTGNNQFGPLTLHFIDVGQGDSTLIACPNGKNILIDAGSTSGVSADIVREHLVNALNHRELRIHSLIITHPDADHYNLLHDLLIDIPIEKAFWVGSRENYSNQIFRNWFFGENFLGNRIRLDAEYFDPEHKKNKEIDCGSTSIFILASGIQAERSSKNAMSIVLMLRDGSFSAILPGDATTDTENTILKRYSHDWLDVDLLKIAHHGSLSTSTSVFWANTLTPGISIVSAGENSRYGHPRLEILERLEPFAIKAQSHAIESATGKIGNYDFFYNPDYERAIFSTVTSGNIKVTIQNERAVVQEY